MKAKFLGDPNDDFSGPKTIRLFGRQFPQGRFVTVEKIGTETDKDVERILGKLSGNAHFEVAEGEGEPAEVAARDPLDHDGNGRRGGSIPKKEVVAALEALAEKHPGQVSFDPTLSGPKLAALLEELRFELGED